MKKVVKKDVVKFEKETKLEQFLPPDIELIIFSFLDVEDLLKVSLVNSDWYKTSISDTIWKKLTNKPELSPTSASWKHYFITLSKPKFQNSSDFTISKDGQTCTSKPKGYILNCLVDTKINLFKSYYFEFQILSFDKKDCWICYGIQYGKEMRSWMGVSLTEWMTSFYQVGISISLEKKFEIDVLDILSFYIRDGMIYFYLNAELMTFNELSYNGKEWVPFIAFSSKKEEMRVKICDPCKYKKLTRNYFKIK